MTTRQGKPAQPQSPDAICLGISSCLLGERVRFDSNHKHDAYITGTLGKVFRFIPVCPEVAIGMGVPRPPIQLVGTPDHPRALGARNKELDVTAELTAYGRRMGARLNNISGYILKNRSPSCGMERVKVYGKKGMASKTGVGIYAREIMAAQPLLPVEEEGRLGDPGLRDNFLERVFAYHRWQLLTRNRLTPARLVGFHTIHKLSLMAHGPEHNRKLGQLVAKAGSGRINDLGSLYIGEFMQVLRFRATNKRHANVLQHLLGYLKKHLTKEDKQELLELIDAFRLGQVPWLVPITLLKHHFRRNPDPYITRQVYLNPSPTELRLRGAL